MFLVRFTSMWACAVHGLKIISQRRSTRAYILARTFAYVAIMHLDRSDIFVCYKLAPGHTLCQSFVCKCIGIVVLFSRFIVAVHSSSHVGRYVRVYLLSSDRCCHVAKPSGCMHKQMCAYVLVCVLYIVAACECVRPPTEDDMPHNQYGKHNAIYRRQ